MGVGGGGLQYLHKFLTATGKKTDLFVVKINEPKLKRFPALVCVLPRLRWVQNRIRRDLIGICRHFKARIQTKPTVSPPEFLILLRPPVFSTIEEEFQHQPLVNTPIKKLPE